MIGNCRGEETADHDHHCRRDSEKPDLVGYQMQRLLRQYQERAGHNQVIAVDEPDEPSTAISIKW